MIRLLQMRWLASLVVAALLIGGCGNPATAPTTAPVEATPILPSGTAPVITPLYPGPGELAPSTPADPGSGYPAPGTTAPAPNPYPGPTPGGAAPGGDAPPTANVASAPSAAGTTPTITAAVLATYPHDPQAYTQGLVYIGDDIFYEGTGMYAASSLREVALSDGAVRRQILLSDALPPTSQGVPFGEGIAVVGQRIFQLTWQHGVGIIYDLNFKPVGRFTYPPPGQPGPVEGWGLTYDPAAKRLIMSDGTPTIYFVDPVATEQTGVLAITGQIVVHEASGTPIEELNELEFIKGELFANIWQQNRIARIDLATGQVNSFVDLSGLRGLMPTAGPEVLNGIAYDEAGDRLFVTGKYWPSLFEIDLRVARAYLPITLVVPPARPATLWS